MGDDDTQQIDTAAILKDGQRMRVREYITARHVAVHRYKAALNMTLLLLLVGVGLTFITRDPIAGAATGYTLALLVDLMKEGG